MKRFMVHFIRDMQLNHCNNGDICNEYVLCTYVCRDNIYIDVNVNWENTIIDKHKWNIAAPLLYYIIKQITVFT